MTISDLAYMLLKKQKQPLHYKAITKKIMKKGRLSGKRPWCTVNSRLCVDGRFVRVGKGRTGLYALGEWQKKK